jgi:VanZ family protein
MGKGRLKIVLSFILIFVWMAIILSFSSDTAEMSKKKSGFVLEKIEPAVVNAATKIGIDNINEDNLHFFVRKNAHMFNYFVLGILVFNGVRLIVLKNKYRFLLSWASTIIFASIDEFYQTFIPGRSGEIRDVFIDNIGSLIGIVFIFLIFNFRKKEKTFLML